MFVVVVVTIVSLLLVVSILPLSVAFVMSSHCRYMFVVALLVVVLLVVVVVVLLLLLLLLLSSSVFFCFAAAAAAASVLAAAVAVVAIVVVDYIMVGSSLSMLFVPLLFPIQWRSESFSEHIANCACDCARSTDWTKPRCSEISDTTFQRIFALFNRTREQSTCHSSDLLPHDFQSMSILI